MEAARALPGDWHRRAELDSDGGHRGRRGVERASIGRGLLSAQLHHLRLPLRHGHPPPPVSERAHLWLARARREDAHDAARAGDGERRDDERSVERVHVEKAPVCARRECLHNLPDTREGMGERAVRVVRRTVCSGGGAGGLVGVELGGHRDAALRARPPAHRRQPLRGAELHRPDGARREGARARARSCSAISQTWRCCHRAPRAASRHREW